MINEPERVAIFGSHKWSSVEKRERAWHAVVDYVNALPEGTIVVSGGAEGVDTWAAEAARRRGLPVEEFPPDPHLPKDRAPTHNERVNALMARNTDIAKRCTRGVAFMDGKTPGSSDTIKKIGRLGKVCEQR